MQHKTIEEMMDDLYTIRHKDVRYVLMHLDAFYETGDIECINDFIYAYGVLKDVVAGEVKEAA